MQGLGSAGYWIAPAIEDELAEALPQLKEFHCSFETARHGVLKLYDSFDWRLWFAGSVLYRTAGRYYLLPRQGFQLDFNQPSGNGYARPVSFAGQFREPELAQQLQKILAPRALIEMANFGYRERCQRVRNGEGKQVALLHRFELSHEASPATKVLLDGLWIAPCKGYQVELESIEADLLAAGWRHEQRNPLEYLLPVERWPRPVCAKSPVKMAPGEPADDLLRRLILTRLQAARVHETGIIKDIDSEFLHDYRVALRMVRSLLSLAPGLFPAAILQRAKREFAALQRQTNLLRDLDVWLLQRESLQTLVPPALQVGFAQLFIQINAVRAEEQRRLRRLLGSAAYHAQMQQWEHELSQPQLWSEAGEVKTAIRMLIDQQLMRRHRRLLKGVERFSQLDDDGIHRLRIQGKKLRYLLELFVDLYPQTPHQWLLNRLRRAQNRLGRYNDLQVQQRHLQQFAETLSMQGKLNADALLAAGAMLAGLAHEQARVRGRIEAPLQAMSGRSGRGHLQRLLGEECEA